MSANTPLISVIVPTYNHSQYVLSALNSIHAQTIAACEVIVINDGSPDDTAMVLRPLAEAGRIRYIETKNSGQAAARNLGLREARGEFVAYLDDDDTWAPDTLENLHRTIANNPAAVACVGQCENFGIGISGCVTRCDEESISLAALKLNCPIVSPGQVLFRMRDLIDAGGFGNLVGGADDWDCYIRFFFRFTFIVENSTVLNRRLHDSNASGCAISMLKSFLVVAKRHTNSRSNPSRRQFTANLLNESSFTVTVQCIAALRRGELKKAITGLWCLTSCVLAAGPARYVPVVLRALCASIRDWVISGIAAARQGIAS